MSRRVWLLVAFLVLVVLLLLLPSCTDKEAIVDVGSSVLSGIWDGRVDGKSLRMELSEDASHTISGRVIVYWPNFADTLAIRHGEHAQTDSLYLDVSTGVEPPIGCTQFFSGRRSRMGSLTGQYYHRCGHDPPTVEAWSASRR